MYFSSGTPVLNSVADPDHFMESLIRVRIKSENSEGSKWRHLSDADP
jgi:hypothetical protein